MDASVSTTKPAGYYGLERADVVAELPQPIGRALDVGCGEGGVGRVAAGRGGDLGDGVEIVDRPPRRRAGARRGVRGLGRGRARERRRSPGRSTRSAATTCSSTSPTRRPCCARCATSPRPAGAAAHLDPQRAPLLAASSTSCCAGRSATREWGHRDATHLRWYTRRDLVALVEGAGWKVHGCASPRVHGPQPLRRPADARHDARVHRLQWHLLGARFGDVTRIVLAATGDPLGGGYVVGHPGGVGARAASVGRGCG